MPIRLGKRWLLIGAAALALGACGTTTGGAGKDVAPGAVEGIGPGGVYKVGKPYQVAGVWYYPAEDYDYDETGIASWYGPGFHAERTANGEIYDQNALTAAHKTLPMPSLVRVTNLENGRSIVLRINDRGPFVAGRIIDLSRRAAQLLGVEQKGTAKVRVQILADESRAIANAARAGGGAGTVYVAKAQGPDDGPVPEAAPLIPVQKEGQPLAAPAAVERQPLDIAATVPGTTAPDGRFLPADKVDVRPVVGPNRIFVQAGAFTLYDNANRLRAALSRIGPTEISPTMVGNTEYFRVRVGPINSVEEADGILSQVLKAGQNSARIIVD